MELSNLHELHSVEDSITGGPNVLSFWYDLLSAGAGGGGYKVPAKTDYIPTSGYEKGILRALILNNHYVYYAYIYVYNQCMPV